MSTLRNFDLNISPRSEGSPTYANPISTHVIGEHSKRARLLDLNLDLENVSYEEVSNQEQREVARNIDINQSFLTTEEGLTNEHETMRQNADEELNNDQLPDLNIDLENNSDEEVSRQSSEEIVRNSDLNQRLSTNTSEEAESQVKQTIKKVMLNNDERRAIQKALLAKTVNGKLKKGTIADISKLFSVSRRTISRIWKLSKVNLDGIVDVSHRKTKNCGRKRIQIDREEFQRVPLSKRTCLRTLSYAMKISPATLYRNVQSGEIRRNTNTIKPSLKETNKKERVQYCLSMIDKSSIPGAPKFQDMNNMIHIDEKWFNISKKCEKFYLLRDERDPLRTCKNKNFLTKVMFLAAVARPRFDSDGNETFSGKIGIFPYVTKEPAKRNSVNRSAGTLETKAITSVGRDISRSYLINKVLPAILEKWPDIDRNIAIYIQQDNARTHINPDDEEFRLAVKQCGLNIRLFCQPPNSPDLNVLDLGFFSAIQSLQYKEPASTIDELILAVEKSFDEFSSSNSNHIFITLQQCMIEIMKVRGSNNYKIPHMNKKSLEKKGELPNQLLCDAKLVEEVTEWLNTCEDVPDEMNGN